MKTTIFSTAFEKKENEFYVNFKNSKRAQWSSFRNYQ